MNIQSISTPVIQDREALEEFADALNDRAHEIERDIARLENTPADREITASLFRSVQNIKGDAALCKFNLGIAIAHPIESLMSRFREGDIQFSELLAETILLAFDRLELATDALLSNKPTESLRLLTLVQGLKAVSETSADDLESSCAELIESVTGFSATIQDISTKPPPRATATKPKQKNTSADLQFFRSLALQFESRSPLFKGRTTRILRLAMETNKAGGSAIDPVQLEAAVYVHDIGMMLLPESVWLKVGKMADEDKIALRNHPGFAGGLLQRMPGWEQAAEMVAQHHETPDGCGYPNKLDNLSICAGAKILAIVDAFEAVMLKHLHRGKNRSVLRAIAEINACDKQCSPEWIGPFNTVIRKTIES